MEFPDLPSHIKAKLLHSFSSAEPRPLRLRLVCKEWDKWVRLNQKKVQIVLYRGDNLPRNGRYVVKNTQQVLTLLERYASVSELDLENINVTLLRDESSARTTCLLFDFEDHFDQLNLKDIASGFAQLHNLERLQLTFFDVTQVWLNELGKLPELRRIQFDQCRLSAEDWSVLGEGIRELIFRLPSEVTADQLLGVMRTLYAGRIPLSKFKVTNLDNSRELASSCHIMLENFASLRTLSHDASLLDGQAPTFTARPLGRMLAVDIEHISFTQIAWSCEARQEQFFATLFARPLPHLRAFRFVSNYPLSEDIVRRLWEMCPVLDMVDVRHLCYDRECKGRLRQAIRKYRAIIELERPEVNL